MAEVRDPMLLVASDTELPPAERVWGTGGWLPPAAREALDWLTLARLCGWAVTVTRRNAPRLDGDLAAGSRWVVLACDSDRLDEELVGRLTARLEAEAVLVVARGARRWRGTSSRAAWSCAWTTRAARRTCTCAGGPTQS